LRAFGNADTVCGQSMNERWNHAYGAPPLS